jgi:hypothetical protein
MDFEKKLKFFKPRNTHIRDHNVLPIWNMGVTEKKYVVSVNFPHKLAIFDQFLLQTGDFGKTVG